jgi:hypothetical protein
MTLVHLRLANSTAGLQSIWYVEVAGVWFIEMSELDALTRATNSAIKSFITQRNDRFRPPCGKHVMERPRQCVFVGTINPMGGYLRDTTGARRFWPVTCGLIDLEALVCDRDQLWAEAVVGSRPGLAGGWRRLSLKVWLLPSSKLDSRSMPGGKGQQVVGWTRRCERR